MQAVGPHHLVQQGPETVSEQTGTEPVVSLVQCGNLPYTKKIASAVLATPVVKRDADDSQLQTTQPTRESKRRSTRLANKPKSDLTLEQQATILLMKKCGTFEGQNDKEPPTVEKITDQFVGPLKEDTVSEYRVLFGLPEEGDADSYGAIAIHAEA